MKCRVCRGQAVIDIRRHNAAFCREHFFEHVQSQVKRSIKTFGMLAPDDKILVAVSGGKDSLALWDILLSLDYKADGLYIGLGIGEYSNFSQEKAEVFATSRGAHLHVVNMKDSYGYDIPQGAVSARRAPCGTCGLSKRYVMNQQACKAGYEVIATGHNLDDEVATLFGNVLHWNLDALSRQRPVLPTEHGFVKKIKPLVRLGEREMAAYCVLRGIDYIVEECPMSEGNTGIRYKEALNEIENASPGTKHQFFFGFLDRGLDHFSEQAGVSAPELKSCSNCGASTTGEICAFCRLRQMATDPERVTVGSPSFRPRRRH